jgi:hypothetical protein
MFSVVTLTFLEGEDYGPQCLDPLNRAQAPPSRSQFEKRSSLMQAPALSAAKEASVRTQQ